MRLFRLGILLCLLPLLHTCNPAPRPWVWQLPEGFPTPVVPADNPMTAAKVALGRYLFYDNNLSANGTQSCASCHQQQYAFSEPSVTSTGSTGEKVRRNSMSLVNTAYNTNFTWAHNALNSIEQHMLVPLFSENPVELGLSTLPPQQVIARFVNEVYLRLFAEAFPGETPSYDLIIKAISSFVRSLVSFNSPFDRYAYYQEDEALSDAALRGLDLFFSERLECHHCHGGFNFSQSSKHDFQTFAVSRFHNTGLYNVDGQGTYPEEDTGLFDITLNPENMGQFRAPSLRNVALTGPYMHDGSVASLREVISLYMAGGRAEGSKNPWKSPFIHGFTLTQQEQEDLLSFLHSLTDSTVLADCAFSNPHVDSETCIESTPTP